MASIASIGVMGRSAVGLAGDQISASFWRGIEPHCRLLYQLHSSSCWVFCQEFITPTLDLLTYRLTAMSNAAFRAPRSARCKHDDDDDDGAFSVTVLELRNRCAASDSQPLLISQVKQQLTVFDGLQFTFMPSSLTSNCHENKAKHSKNNIH